MNNSDVIIIGGGIIGTSIAYALAKKNKGVLLFEKKGISSGASGASAAMLEFQIDANRGEPFYSLAQKSLALFPALEQEIKNLNGIDFQYENCGIYHLALSDDEAVSLRTEVRRQTALGLKATWFNREKMEAEIPTLNEGAFGAAFFEEDGQVNGERFTRAMADAAKKKGAILHENKPVDRILKSNSGWTVLSGKETWHANAIVVAAGAWSDIVLAPLNLVLGFHPVRGQLLFFDTPKRFLKSPIYTRANGYITPKIDGYTFVGTTVEKAGFDETVTEEAKTSLMEKARALVPYLADRSVRGLSAGLRPGSPDDLPVIGEVPGHPQLYVASGHYRNGILLAPVTAQIIAALILDSDPPLDPTPFSPARLMPRS